MDHTIVDLLQKLVATETTVGHSIEGAMILHEFFEQNGISSQLDSYGNGEANVIATIGKKNLPKFVLSGHIDTVPFGDEKKWKFPPLSAKIEDGKMWGRGTVDMKGGLAALATTMVALLDQEADLNYQFVFLGSAQEEVGLLGAARMQAQGWMEDAEYLVVGEPTNLEPKAFEKGIIWFDIKVIGKQAHASRPDLGKNAIEGICKIMKGLPSILPNTSIPEVGKSTINFGMIEGGSAYNVVAEETTLSCDIRTTPGVSNQDVIESLKKYLKSMEEEDLKAEVEFIQEEPAVQTSDMKFPELFVELSQSIAGKSSRIGGTYFATDAAVLLKELEIPMVIFGPGSTELLHQTNEHVHLNDVFLAQKIYFEACKRINFHNS